MTLRELAQRLKKASANDNDAVRQILSDSGIGEFTVYSPTQRWKEILENLGLSELESRTVCVTCYAATPEVFDTIKATLKKKYKAVSNAQVDELGFRQIFIAGNNPDSEPQLLLLVNYYEEARDVVKSMYNEGTSDNAAYEPTDAEPTDIDIDPFE